MYKLVVLAVCATLSLAQQPMPLMYGDFEATSYHFTWDNTKITPLNTWTTQKWSSMLNKIYEIEGTINDDGDQITTAAEVTDVTAKIALTYREDEGCKTASDVQVDNVADTIAHFFDGFTFEGLQYAPWELTRNKYYRLDGKGMQYFYKVSNLQVRFIAWPGETETKIFDFQGGLTEEVYTPSDFVLPQCQKANYAAVTPSQFLQ